VAPEFPDGTSVCWRIGGSISAASSPSRHHRPDQSVSWMRARVGAAVGRGGNGFVGMLSEVLDRDAKAGSNRGEHANEDSARQRSPRIGWLGRLRHNTRLRPPDVGRLRGSLMNTVESLPCHGNTGGRSRCPPCAAPLGGRQARFDGPDPITPSWLRRQLLARSFKSTQRPLGSRSANPLPGHERRADGRFA
jgi:hypothetical protein